MDFHADDDFPVAGRAFDQLVWNRHDATIYRGAGPTRLDLGQQIKIVMGG